MANRNGKVISISSVKGGVGKTTMVTNLAGLYYLMKKKVLIIDADFYSGGISAWLDIRNKKDIFMMIDSISNNRYSNIKDYVTSYNNGIDVLASPKDPRCALKVESKYIPMIFEFARREYDVILVDTNHIMNVIKNNIDYNISNSFYIKNIDKYVINGEILTLNRNIIRFHAKDINKLKAISEALIKEEGTSE